LDISGNQIVISNLGTKPITQNDLKIVIDNNPVSSFNIEGGSIDAGKTGIVTFQASLSEGMHRIIVINKGVSQATSFYYSALTTTMWTTTFVVTTTTPSTTPTTIVVTTTTRPPTTTPPTTTRVTTTVPTTIVPCYSCGFYPTYNECRIACGSPTCDAVVCGNNPNCWKCPFIATTTTPPTTTIVPCYSCGFYPTYNECRIACGSPTCDAVVCGNNPNCWKCPFI
jgi:hypothetical protein